MIDESLPTLAQLLAPTCQAEIGRRIGRPRGYVWRLFNGRPLRSDEVIEPLARALNQPVEFVRAVVINDRKRARRAA